MMLSKDRNKDKQKDSYTSGFHNHRLSPITKKKHLWVYLVFFIPMKQLNEVVIFKIRNAICSSEDKNVS